MTLGGSIMLFIVHFFRGIPWAVPGIAIAGIAVVMGRPWTHVLGGIGLGLALFSLGFYLSVRKENKNSQADLAALQESGFDAVRQGRHIRILTAALERPQPLLKVQIAGVAEVLTALAGYEKADPLFALLDRYARGDDRAGGQFICPL